MTLISLDLCSDDVDLSLFDMGKAEIDVGIKNGAPYASAMLSLLNPSVTFDLWGATISVGVHLGSIGAGVSLVPGEIGVEYANVVGCSFSIS